MYYNYESMSPFIRAVFEHNIYKCIGINCEFKSSLSGIRQHLKVCKNIIVKCTIKGCKQEGIAEFIDGEHAKQCEFRLIACIACEATMRKNQQDAHKCRPNILRIIGRGKIKRKCQKRYFIQAVVEFQTPCFSKEEWEKRVIRGVIQTETVWSALPWCEGPWRLAD